MHLSRQTRGAASGSQGYEGAASGSLTDSSKLEQQRSDHPESSQTDEHKARLTPHHLNCSHASPNNIPCLTDTGTPPQSAARVALSTVQHYS